MIRSHLTFVALLIVGCAVGTEPAPSGSSTGTAPPEGDVLADDEGAESLVPNSNKTAAPDASAAAEDDAGAVDAKAKGPEAAPPEAAASVSACPGYALPNDSANCKACQQSASNCQPNGCYGGYYCETDVDKCRPKPSGC